jgi:NADH:ubiquinone oxidoreductase subunit E
MLADLLNPSRAEAHGVVTFYHDFRRNGDRTTSS